MTGTAQDDPINRVAVTTAAFNVVVISNVISSLMPQHFGAPTFIETRVRLRLLVFMSAFFLQMQPIVFHEISVCCIAVFVTKISSSYGLISNNCFGINFFLVPFF